MSERAPYSRVYWSVMDDAKFDGIREDTRHLGSWCLLLIVADMAWPAPAFPPPAVSRASMKALTEAGLIDPLSGGRFRIHGLDAERGRRREAARSGGKRSPDGDQTGTTRVPNGAQDETSLDKTRRNGAQPRATGSLRDEMTTAIAATYPDYGMSTLEAVEARKRA